MTKFEDTLRERPVWGKLVDPDNEFVSLSEAERDAIADALGTLREIAGMGEGWFTTSALAKAALGQLDGLVSE
jgi:hypothetical protein